MKDSKKIPQERPTLEEEILRERKFDLSEAVARQAAGALKGASPIPRWRQVLQEIKSLLSAKLYDPEGSLQEAILEHLKNTLPVADNPRQSPDDVLSAFLRRTLASPSALAELVRQTDILWGRRYGEKPLFDEAGEPPHPDDPYTLESVSSTLKTLLQALT